MTFARYSNPWPIGVGRGGTRARNTKALWLVLHTSQGSEGINSAEALARFIGTPATSTNVASYQAVTDTDEIEQLVLDHLRCHGAAGANDKGLHLCFPGDTRQLINQWFDDISAAYLEMGARWAADKCIQEDIPPVKITPAQMRANVRGICGHNDVRLAFGQTTHTDPEPNFPWNWFINRVQQILTPQKPPPPPRPVAKGTPVFIAVYANQYSYLVQCNLDETFVKHDITGNDFYLYLIAEGLLPLINKRDWDAWLEEIPEV